MPKTTNENPSAETNVQSAAEPATAEEASPTPVKATCTYLLVSTSIAPKLGARAEGRINYQVLADTAREHLFIAITGNESGGYFSRELVPFHKIQTCLDKNEKEKPFPSKTFADAFVGRSSNNPGFLVAVLRFVGLLAAAPDAESKHIVSGDWATWEKSMLAEPGTTIELPIEICGSTPAKNEPVPEHTEHRKTLKLPRKK